MVFDAKPPFKILDVNELWLQTCGFAREQAVGSTLEALTGEHSAADWAGLVESAAAGAAFSASLLSYSAVGQPFRLAMEVAPAHSMVRGPGASDRHSRSHSPSVPPRARSQQGCRAVLLVCRVAAGSRLSDAHHPCRRPRVRRASWRGAAASRTTRCRRLHARKKTPRTRTAPTRCARRPRTTPCAPRWPLSRRAAWSSWRTTRTARTRATSSWPLSSSLRRR